MGKRRVGGSTKRATREETLAARMRALLREDRHRAIGTGQALLGTRIEQDKRDKLREKADGKE